MQYSDNALASCAPVALFVYNRPFHLRQVVDSLLKNAEASATDLYIFSDAAKNPEAASDVETVRDYIRGVVGFRSLCIVEQKHNLGLAASIISGVSKICRSVGRVIVLEDDLVVAPYFLKFMNEGLTRYAEDVRVGSILGYSLPLPISLPETYFVRGADCYGWATWERAWKLFETDGSKLLDALILGKQSEVLDMNGALDFTQMLKDQIAKKNDSWAIRWHVSMFLRGMLTLTPNKSLVINIGADGSGTNFGRETLLDTKLTNVPVRVGNIPVAEHYAARIATEHYYRSYKSLAARIFRRILRMFN